MSILAVSVSHKTAPVEALARLALDAPTSTKLVDALLASEHIDEAIVLSTCNRTEIYAAVSRFHGALDDISTTLADFAGMTLDDLQDVCAVYFDEGAVAHTFSVASGLDSVVVGESQVLGQVKAALTHCQAVGSVGTVLNTLFQSAIRVAKRVHSETGIGSAGRSLVTAAYELLTRNGGDLAGQRVLVVGAGAMASLAARTAADAGAAVTCANRTLTRAQRLAAAVGGAAVELSELSGALKRTDVLVTCTGAKTVSITAADLADTPVSSVVDLALPADVDPAVADLGIELVNLERLVAEQKDSGTGAEAEFARDLVRQEVTGFLSVRRSAQVAPTVVALRSMASSVVAAELARLDGKLPNLGARERAEVQRTVGRIVDKLLHQPTVRVQELAADPDALDYAAALRELFALHPQSVAAVMSTDVPR
ncbi:MAG TPA: glutamyl-tRNA reductase [Propionibacteriaceae bacterium]|jgi:glutamyl-tRNA reductase|nr:glutamyl-tRNA reductase [Propionibacteriaceae bacterium]